MTYTPSHRDPSRPRRGRLRRWIGRKLRGLLHDSADLDTRTPSPVQPVTASINQTTTVTFTTPSKGDAYDFSVTAELCLCATGQLAADQLQAKLEARIPAITAELKSAARPVARDYPPFRPGAAEPNIATALQQAVETALAGVPDADGAVLTCTVQVRVDMPDEVREMQRLAVAEQVKFEARYEQSEQAAQRLGELRVVWSKFIHDGLRKWETPYAILMAQHPAQVDATLFKMRADRQEEAAKLVDTVAAVAAGHDRMDLLEFALATDSALSKTYELLGIVTPGKDEIPSSNFGEPDRKGTNP